MVERACFCPSTFVSAFPATKLISQASLSLYLGQVLLCFPGASAGSSARLSVAPQLTVSPVVAWLTYAVTKCRAASKAKWPQGLQSEVGAGR